MTPSANPKVYHPPHWAGGDLPAQAGSCIMFGARLFYLVLENLVEEPG